MTGPAGPVWNDDDPADLPIIEANAAALVHAMHADAAARAIPTADTVLEWHRELYAGCTVPVAEYVAHFRGDPDVPELVDYEVGVGPELPDGWPERVGVWSPELAGDLSAFFAGLAAALGRLDVALPHGTRPTTVDEVATVVRLVAAVHGEWVRLHPFANGNGRTARLLAAFIALRYSLPVFVTVKPRPDDVAYARASKASMGRPPDFVGDHSAATAVFGHLLTLTLLQQP